MCERNEDRRTACWEVSGGCCYEDVWGYLNDECTDVVESGRGGGGRRGGVGGWGGGRGVRGTPSSPPGVGVAGWASRWDPVGGGGQVGGGRGSGGGREVERG